MWTMDFHCVIKGVYHLHENGELEIIMLSKINKSQQQTNVTYFLSVQPVH